MLLTYSLAKNSLIPASMAASIINFCAGNLIAPPEMQQRTASCPEKASSKDWLLSKSVRMTVMALEGDGFSYLDVCRMRAVMLRALFSSSLLIIADPTLPHGYSFVRCQLLRLFHVLSYPNNCDILDVHSAQQR